MIHVSGYHEYIGGDSVHQRDTMMHVGQYHDSCWGSHDYSGGYSALRVCNIRQRLLLISSSTS